MRGAATAIIIVLTLLALAATGAPALAGPVLPDPVRLSQPDGTTVHAVPYGDEWDSGYETADGFTVVQDATTGMWFYAAMSDGALAPSALVPGRDAPDGLTPHLRNSTIANPNRFAIFPDDGTRPAGFTGPSPVLVILVSFSNRPPIGTTPAQWSNVFFGATNSAKHYYQEVSYNQLTLTPVVESFGTANDGVIGWLNLGYPHPNTGDDSTSANQQLTKDAILAANPHINFAAYDTNHDGYISGNELHIVVIVAGYETSYGGAAVACSPSVWGHQWSLNQIGAPVVDGVIVGEFPYGGYAQFGEWHCSGNDSPGHMATMGIMVHEMGHDISWPDLYDTSGVTAGVGRWSIMGSGSWGAVVGGYEGAKPTHPDAFLKWYQGWMTPEQVTGARPGMQLQQVESNQRAILVLDNPNGVDWAFTAHSGAGEFFLLENRQQMGYDAGMPGCGILIWHIDESRPYDNSANATASRRLVSLEEADGRGDLDAKANKGDTGDPYPGSAANRSFTASSNPNSNKYGGIASGVSVTNISGGCASTMSADITAPGSAGPTSTATRTPTNVAASPTPTSTPVGPTPTASRTPAVTATRTPGGAVWTIYLPVILKSIPSATATPSPTQTPVGTGWTTIMAEDFEGAFPGPWVRYYDNPNDAQYVWGKRSCRVFAGQNSGWAVGGGRDGSSLPCGSSYPDNNSSLMAYGPFSLASAHAAELNFEYWRNSEDDYDWLCAYGSLDGENFWGQCGSGSSSGWASYSLDLTDLPTLGDLTGNGQVWIGLRFYSDELTNAPEGAYVDDIVLRKCTSGDCPAAAPGEEGVTTRPDSWTVH